MEKNLHLLRDKDAAMADLNALSITHQDTADVHAENELLKRHRENISMLATELAARTDRIKSLRSDNDAMQADLAEAQSSIVTLQRCHDEMMQKIQMLQDSNDLLTVHLEGIKAQCQCLANYNLLGGGGEFTAAALEVNS